MEQGSTVKTNEMQLTHLKSNTQRKELVTRKHKQCDSIYIKCLQHTKLDDILLKTPNVSKAKKKSERKIDTNFKF